MINLRTIEKTDMWIDKVLFRINNLPEYDSIEMEFNFTVKLTFRDANIVVNKNVMAISTGGFEMRLNTAALKAIKINFAHGSVKFNEFYENGLDLEM